MKKNKYEINELNINSYTLEDSKLVFEKAKKNKDGYPLIYPTKNIHGKKMVLTFINAEIYDLKGNKVSDHIANFNIADDEEFNKDDANAKLIIEFISALLSNSRIVRGGVYFKGKYYTGKMTLKHAKMLTKSFMHSYFHLEDRDLLFEWFDKMDNTGRLPYWPTKSYDKNARETIFSAVNATITPRGEHVLESDPLFNFDIKKGDTFDLNNPEDKIKTEVIRSLLFESRVVSGFYYKGELIENHLSNARRNYFEKSFVKKNFTINQRDFLFSFISKNKVDQLPIYWPMKDENNREIVISVVNAGASWISEKYANFDVYTDEFFDITNDDFKMKLKIIQRMYARDPLISGALYFDGVLVSSMKKQEVERRKQKAEKALKIFIDNNDDFTYINEHFSIEDREKILRITSKYDHYALDDKTRLPKRDNKYLSNEEIYDLKVVDANVVSEFGDYVFKKPISFTIKDYEVKLDKNMMTLFKALVNPTIKVRGQVYFHGIYISCVRKGKIYNDFLNNFLKNLLSEKDYQDLLDSIKNVKYYAILENKKTKMPIYWPTKNKMGREVLLSTVDADVHFKNGRNIIRASNDMNFDIYVGETFGLVGESGSGKTTISRAILGINKLAKGGIYFRGKLISSGLSKQEKKQTKKNIQMIFQDPAASLNERANIDYIVSEGLYNFHLFKSNDERLEKVNNMMRQVGLLPEHLSRYPHEFSGGQRQRIGIARALIIEPQLVLADEPISALDVSIRAQVLNLLKKLQDEQSLTYLFIAHDLSIIRYISDRIAVMHRGYIVELGPAEEIYSHPLHPYTKSLLTAIPQPDPRTKALRKKIPYDQGNIVYGKCVWKDYGNEHYVLVNDDLDKIISKEIK